MAHEAHTGAPDSPADDAPPAPPARPPSPPLSRGRPLRRGSLAVVGRTVAADVLPRAARDVGPRPSNPLILAAAPRHAEVDVTPSAHDSDTEALHEVSPSRQREDVRLEDGGYGPRVGRLTTARLLGDDTADQRGDATPSPRPSCPPPGLDGEAGQSRARADASTHHVGRPPPPSSNR